MLYYRGALFVLGRFVSEAIGEQQYFPDNERMSYATAAESAKSNCLMRCCKDLGIASELWDPSYARGWVGRNAVEVWCTNVGSHDPGRKKRLWRKKGAPAIEAFPWKEEQQHGSEARAIAPPVAPSKAPRAAAEARPAAPRPSPGRQVALAPLVSIKQVGRFRAIARTHGWSETESDQLLAKFGFGSAEEMTRDAYDRICSALENKVVLTEVRAEIEEEYRGK